MKTYIIPQTDLEVSRIGYGCALLGWDFPEGVPIDQLGSDFLERAASEPLSGKAIDQADRVINAAYDHGVNLFDHSDMYAFGKTELVFGEVLKRSPHLRGRVVIQTKCAIRFRGWPLTKPEGRFDPPRFDNGRDYIVRSAEASLKRLGVDTIDVYLLHAPDAMVEPEEVSAAFDHLHTTGKVRHFGVSNHTGVELELLRKWLKQPLVVNQIPLSLDWVAGASVELKPGVAGIHAGLNTVEQWTHKISAIVNPCRINDMQVQVYSPLRANIELPPQLLNPAADASETVKDTALLLRELAKEKGVTPAAIMLAWLLNHPARMLPLIGSTNPKNIRGNCAADDVSLSREEWYALLATAAGAGQWR